MAKIDPEYAKKITKNDYYRLSRALDIIKVTGKPLEKFNTLSPNEEFDFRGIIITMDRIELFQLLERRCERIIEEGFFEEVDRLMKMGISSKTPKFGVGYHAALQLMEKGTEIKEKDFDEFLLKFKAETRNLVRVQLIWSRKNHRTGWVWLNAKEDNQNKIKSLYEMKQDEFINYTKSKENIENIQNSVNEIPFREWAKKIDLKYIYNNKFIYNNRIQFINNLIDQMNREKYGVKKTLNL